MGTAERDQAIAAGCTVVTASQKGLISQIGAQHHPAGAVTNQRDAFCRRLALKFTHSGINAIKQATPTEAPAGGQPIQFGRRHDAHRSAARSYRQIMGDPDLQGDGLVPLSSALLRDARWIELADTAHGGLFGHSWYGSTDRIERWWSQLGD